MRVTQFSKFTPLQSAIEGIQSRKYLNEVRLATGKQIVDISESPNALSETKRLDNLLDLYGQYKKNIDYSIGYIQYVTETIDSISANFQKLREVAIDATKTGVVRDLPILGNAVRGLLNDIVKDLNSDFNGQFIFSGTLTSPESIQQPPGSLNTLPFEIIQENPSSNNPSGLKVVFKGNNNRVVINTSKVSSEILNTTANDLFGDATASSLNSIVELYNLLTYDSNGNLRDSNDLFSQSDLLKLNELQKKFGEIYDKVLAMNSRNGSLLNRLEVQSDQTNAMMTNLKGLKSKVADADYSATSLELMKDQTALQFALQVGARLTQTTLFDFLR